MTPQEFKAWREAMGFTQQAAADAIGVSIQSVRLYEKGVRPGADPRPVEIPKTVALACAAIAYGMSEADALVQEWPETPIDVDMTPHRALYASLLDNVDKPAVVKVLAERWFESERELMQALLDDQARLSVHQTVLLHRAVGA